MANWVADLMQRSDLSGLPIVKRDRGSVHFRRPGGEIVAVCTGMPCHYLDPVDGWMPLDTSLRLDVSKNNYGAPGLATRVAMDGFVVIPSQSRGPVHHSQCTENFVVFDAKAGKVKHVIAKLPAGKVDGENVVRETASCRHNLRFMETGVVETLTIYQAPPSTGSASEWAMLETAMPGQSWPDGWLESGPAVDGVIFQQPLCVDANGIIVKARQYAKKKGAHQYLYTGVPLAWLAGAAYPVVLDPTFTDTTYDEEVTGISSVYATARSTASATGGGSNFLAVGQTYVNVKGSITYNISRSFLRFDTSSLLGVISQVNLTATGYFDSSDTDFDVVIQKFDWSAYVPLDAYERIESAFDGALAADADANIWLNTSALTLDTPQASGNLATAWVQKMGYTYYALCSSRDIAATEPAGAESIMIYAQEYGTASKRPFLTIAYTPVTFGYSNSPRLAGSFAPRLARPAAGGSFGSKASRPPKGGSQGYTK